MKKGFSVASELGGDRPTLSFEFFPPKDELGVATLNQTVEELLKVSPDFVSVTYGAMGSNQESSIAVVEKLSPLVPTIAHLTCIGATTAGIQKLMHRYDGAGVAGILALRGDKPQDYSEPTSNDFNYASDLVELVKDSTQFEIGVAAFPEKHPESLTLEDDIKILKMKQDSGANFAMTQLFFDVDAYSKLVEDATAAGVNIPIVPGVMPIANVKQVFRMAQMSGAAIPPKLELALGEARKDEDARAIGMNFSSELVRRLLAIGAPGIHIFTLNQHRAALELVKAAELA